MFKHTFIKKPLKARSLNLIPNRYPEKVIEPDDFVALFGCSLRIAELEVQGQGVDIKDVKQGRAQTKFYFPKTTIKPKID